MLLGRYWLRSSFWKYVRMLDGDHESSPVMLWMYSQSLSNG